MTRVNNRLAVLLLSMCLLASLMSGCSPETEGPATPTEKVFVFARPEDLNSWDPHDHMALSNMIVERLIYDTLTEVNSRGELIPALATEWTHSDDGKTWTFKLREGAKFHNGEPVNAESVKVTLDRFLNETLVLGSIFENLESVSVVDDTTVTVKLKVSDGSLLYSLAGTPIIPAQAFREKGKALFDHPIGSGPFEFVGWKKGDKIEVKRFEDYWGQPAKVDRIIYRPITEASTRVAGIKTGEIDVADSIPSDDAATLAQDANVELIRFPAWQIIHTGLKCDRPPFNDKKVRQAFSYALDREAITEFILQGGLPWDSYIPTGVLGADPDLQPEPRDVEAAKRLLAEAGYPDGVKVTMIVPDGWFPKTKEVIEAIRAQCLEAGIDISLNLMDGAAFRERRAAGDWDIFITSEAFVNGDPDRSLSVVIPADAYHTGYRNEPLNELIAQAKSAPEIHVRADLYHEVLRIMRDEYGPLPVICQTEYIAAARKGVSGVGYRGDMVIDLRYCDKQP